MKEYLAAIGLVVLLSGCANPLNRATSDRYADQCVNAENAGRLDIAEEACYRAAVNVEWGNLGDELKSERLYNLARVKRRLGKLDEAERYLIETIKIEEALAPPRRIRMGRRLRELSVIYYEQKRYQLALPSLKQLLPISHLYSGEERTFLANLFHYYAIELSGEELAESLRRASIELGFDASRDQE